MPDVTASLIVLTEATFDAVASDGQPLHFRDRFADGQQTIPIFYHDQLTDTATGQTARQVIAAQAITHGFPLTGIYISGSGGTVPHTCIHRSEFPSQNGPPDQRADRLQTEIDAAFEAAYKTSMDVTDPTDPDFGQTKDLRNFWAACHVWNYKNDSNTYTPRVGGAGDFQIYINNKTPPGNWWRSSG